MDVYILSIILFEIFTGKDQSIVAGKNTVSAAVEFVPWKEKEAHIGTTARTDSRQESLPLVSATCVSVAACKIGLVARPSSRHTTATCSVRLPSDIT